MKALPKSFGNLAAYSSALVTIFVTTKFNVDPVNLPKLFLLSVFAFSAFALVCYSWDKQRFTNIFSLLLFVFVISQLLSSIFSDAPWQLSFYGADARNTGFLLYLALSLLAFSISQVHEMNVIRKYLFSVYVVGAIQIVYGLFQVSGLDFVDWKNVYHTALGTLGNPNFFAAYVGLSVAALVPYFFISINYKFRILIIVYILLALVGIALSKSIQGFATIFIGVFVTFLISLKYSRKNKGIKYLGVGTLSILTVAGILGMLQVGPFATFLYKPSISLRGFYWHAGIEMFKSNPILGLGPDSYGDWYRKYRSVESIKSPGGVDIISNAAHNVFLDFAANGGLLVAGAYLAIVMYVTYKAIIVLSNLKDFDPLVVAIVVIWISYLAQSFISINQIGLAVWGWSSGAMIIALSRLNINGSLFAHSATPKQKKYKSDDFSNFFLGAGIILGVLIAAPALRADHDWYSAVRGKDLNVFLKAAKSQPLNSKRLVDASNILLMNNLSNESKELNSVAIKLDRNYYYTWMLIYMNPLSTEIEKKQAVKNLHRLDPLNPKWK